MTDLEWLATHLGWTELEWGKDKSLWGIPPKMGRFIDSYRGKEDIPFPLYDQSIDLMVELVQAMSLCDRENWTEILVELVMQKTEIHDYFDYINAPASLRLKAYRQVMEGDNTQCL